MTPEDEKPKWRLPDGWRGLDGPIKDFGPMIIPEDEVEQAKYPWKPIGYVEPCPIPLRLIYD